VRRQWLAVLLCLVLGLLAALAWLEWAPKEFRASTSVLVLPTDRNATNNNDGINLDTEAQLVTSTDTAVAAAEILDEPSSQAQELAEQVAISVPPNSDILDITFTGSSAAEARAGSAAFAQAYLAQREAAAETARSAEQEGLQTRIDELGTQLDDALGAVSRLEEGSAGRRRASAQANLLNNQIAGLTSQLNQISTANSTPGRVVTEATAPTSQSGPDPLVVLAAGAVLGLLLGAGVAGLRNRADDAIRRPQDLVRRTGLPATAVLSGRLHDGQVDVVPALGPNGRGYARLRNLVTTRLQAERRVVVVAGVQHGGGPVAVNLAASLARAGEDVVLVCADVFGPTTRALLGGRPRAGLTEVLAGEITVADAVQPVPGVPDLRVLGAGRDPDRADALLQTRGARRLVEQLAASGAYIVIEAPATHRSADAQTLANLAEAAVLVVELDQAKGADVLDAVDQFESMGTPVLGTVVARYGRGRERLADDEAETPVDGTSPGPAAPATRPIGAHAASKAEPADGGALAPGVRDATTR
jgi:Mrp family chromosome partitioning ATPase/capsular polysaccharide biosynthesis protein